MVNREAKRDVTVSKDALLKSYSKRLKDDVRSLADNFSAIVKTCRYSGHGNILEVCHTLPTILLSGLAKQQTLILAYCTYWLKYDVLG